MGVAIVDNFDVSIRAYVLHFDAFFRRNDNRPVG